jgi:hypothetical protein
VTTGTLIESVAPGHDVTVETVQLGDDTAYEAVCTCGHRSAPHLIPDGLVLLARHHAKAVA